MKTVVYDCETQKLFDEIPDKKNVWDLLMSTAVTYCYETDDYKFWTYNTQTELIQYLNGSQVIGFNTLRFDNPLLLGEDYTIEDDGLCRSVKLGVAWKNYDIYVEIIKVLLSITKKPMSEVMVEVCKFRPPKGVYNLDSLAQATLNHKKSADGLAAVEFFRSKKILELIQYNQQDVRVTKQLYEFIRKNGYIINGNYDVMKFR